MEVECDNPNRHPVTWWNDISVLSAPRWDLLSGVLSCKDDRPVSKEAMTTKESLLWLAKQEVPCPGRRISMSSPKEGLPFIEGIEHRECCKGSGVVAQFPNLREPCLPQAHRQTIWNKVTGIGGDFPASCENVGCPGWVLAKHDLMERLLKDSRELVSPWSTWHLEDDPLATLVEAVVAAVKA